MGDTAIEKCENCGEKIGKFETPFVWQDVTVCERCYGRLAKNKAAGRENGGLADPRGQNAVRDGPLTDRQIREEQERRLVSPAPYIAQSPDTTRKKRLIFGALAAVLLTSLAIWLAFYFLNSQRVSGSKIKYDSLDQTLSFDTFNTDWRLGGRARTGAEKAGEFQSWFAPKDVLMMSGAEVNFIRSHGPEFTALVGDLPGAYGNGNGYLDGCPFRICNVDDGVCILAVRFGVDTVYNTLKLTEKQAAAKIVMENGLGRLEALAGAGRTMGAAYVGTATTFYMKDFGDGLGESRLYADTLTVATIARVTDVEKYSKKQLSEDDLIDEAKVFLNNGSGFHLVKIKLE